MRRRTKLWLYLMLAVVLSAALWLLTGKPLPWYWDYRRAEQSWLMEPKEVLGRVKAAEAAVSRDADHLYLHTRRWDNRPARIDQSPIENGTGRFLLADVMMEHTNSPFWVIAWEESGRAVRATLQLQTWNTWNDREYLYEASAVRDGALFVWELSCQEPREDGMSTVEAMAEADLLRAIYELECRKQYTMYPDGGYAMIITFWDEFGEVLSVHSSGAAFPEKD